MSALERLERLPDWPARMTAPIAAAYMGVSQSTFLARFGSTGVKEGANTFWARTQLDRLVEQQFGLASVQGRQPGLGSGDVEDDIAAWKAGRGRR